MDNGAPPVGPSKRTPLLKLTKLERAAFHSLHVRLQEMQADEMEYMRDVEQRLGLDPMSIGTTHLLDWSQGAVVPMPPRPPQPGVPGQPGALSQPAMPPPNGPEAQPNEPVAQPNTDGAPDGTTQHGQPGERGPDGQPGDSGQPAGADIGGQAVPN